MDANDHSLMARDIERLVAELAAARNEIAALRTDVELLRAEGVSATPVADERVMPILPTVVVPDADTTETATPIRRTLEHNPQSTAHKYELQLYNVDTAEELAKTIPFVELTSDAGDLKWAAVDSNRNTPTQQSLEIVDGGEGATFLQIKDWNDATGGTLEANDLLLTRKDSDKSAKYLAASAFKGDQGDAGPQGEKGDTGDTGPAGTTLHHELTDVTDHDDHTGGRAAVVGDSGKGLYIHAEGDSTRNAMSGVLGDSSNAKSVAPSEHKLYGTDGTTVTLDYTAQSSGFCDAPTDAEEGHALSATYDNAEVGEALDALGVRINECGETINLIIDLLQARGLMAPYS